MRRKEGGREGRKEAGGGGRGEMRGGRGDGGGGGGALSCTGMNMTQRQQPEPLLSSPFEPHPSIPTDRQERGEREGTVSMATAEQR